MFEKEASISTFSINGVYPKTGESIYSETWPSPRGYFAYSLIDHNQTIDENCYWDIDSFNQLPSESEELADDEGFDIHCTRVISSASDSVSSGSTSVQTASSKGISTRTHKSKTVEEYFNGKALLIQGGCNENFETFSDFYVFVLKSENGRPYRPTCMIISILPNNHTRMTMLPYLSKKTKIQIQR